MTSMSRAAVWGSESASITEFTGPLGTPAAVRSASHSSEVRVTNAASRMSISATALWRRAVKSMKRASSASSGCPMTTARRYQNFSFGHATTSHPSAEGKAWNGTMDGCAEWWVLTGTKSLFNAHAAG